MTSMVLLMLTAVLIITAVSGVLHQARDRGAALADTGAAFMVLGGLAFFGEAVIWMTAMALPGGDPTEMAAYFDRMTDSALVATVATTLFVCFAIGAAVLPWAAWRAGAVHWWVPVLATVAVVAEFGLPFHSTASEIVVFTALAAAYGAIGLRVLRMTDAEWDGVRSSTRAEAPVPA